MPSSPQTAAPVQVWDYLLQSGGSVSTTTAGIPNITVRATLQYDQALFTNPVVALHPTTYQTTTDQNGYWTLYLLANTGNDPITPSGTTWLIQIPGYAPYEIQVTDVSVPVGGWQSSALLVNTPSGIGPFAPTLPSIIVNGSARIEGPDPWYDVTHPAFGAKGDGTTDDSAAIQAAINAAGNWGTVFFPNGRYKILTGLVTTFFGQTFLSFGGGSQSANFSNAGRMASVQIDVVGSITGLKLNGTVQSEFPGPRVYGIHFHGDGSANQIGVQNDSFTNWLYQGVTCSDFLGTGAIGFSFTASGGVTLTGYGDAFDCSANDSTIGIDVSLMAGITWHGGMVDGLHNAIGAPPTGTTGIRLGATTSQPLDFKAFGTKIQSVATGIDIQTANQQNQFYGCRFENVLTAINISGSANDVIGGTFNVASSRPATPSAALAGAGAGNIDNGLHSWKVTNITARGETGGSSASGQVNVVDKTTNGQVTVTIPVSAQTNVTGRKIYRTIAGDTGNWLLVGTVNDNTSTTFTDNVSDASLGAAIPQTTAINVQAGVGLCTLLPGRISSFDNGVLVSNSAGFNNIFFDGGGHMFMGQPVTSPGKLVVRPSATTEIGVRIQPNVAQTADLIRVDNTSGVAMGGITSGGGFYANLAALTDAATVATDARTGWYFTLAATASRTIGLPTNPRNGQRITYDILNSSGGAMTTTWNGVFKLAGAWVDPANTKRRKITFTYDGTNWVEDSRTGIDI